LYVNKRKSPASCSRVSASSLVFALVEFARRCLATSVARRVSARPPPPNTVVAIARARSFARFRSASWTLTPASIPLRAHRSACKAASQPFEELSAGAFELDGSLTSVRARLAFGDDIRARSARMERPRTTPRAKARGNASVVIATCVKV